MSPGSGFEEYLVSKKIDSLRFHSAEPDVWQEWKSEFDQMHPNSFTAQKLNLLNPVRRKYPLMAAPGENQTAVPPPDGPVASPPKPGRPIIRPKIN